MTVSGAQTIPQRVLLRLVDCSCRLPESFLRCWNHLLWFPGFLSLFRRISRLHPGPGHTGIFSRIPIRGASLWGFGGNLDRPNRRSIRNSCRSWPCRPSPPPHGLDDPFLAVRTSLHRGSLGYVLAGPIPNQVLFHDGFPGVAAGPWDTPTLVLDWEEWLRRCWSTTSRTL